MSLHAVSGSRHTPSASAARESVPVLIVGAGPGGLTLSLLLARFGVQSMIVERRRGPSVLPRATGVNVRSMEIYRSVGLQDAIDAVSMPTDVPFLLVGETLATPPQEAIESNHWGPSTESDWPSPTHANWCAQDRLEAVLLDAVRGEPDAELCFGTELLSFQPVDGVAALVRDVGSGETRTVHCQYLVGADGASSRVRESLGITMRGQSGLSSELNILFCADLEPLLGGRRFCMYRINGGRVGGVLRPAGRSGRWLFGTPGSAETSEAQLVETIRAAAGDPRLAVRIIATAAWEASARVAESFRSGPVLLIGDAAHQHTPGGGFGMNSAIQGAHNLAWKLTAVLHHHAGEGLFDTYQTERRPLAEFTTTLSVSMLQARGRDSARTLGVILGAHYEQGALAPDGTTPPEPGDPIADYQQCARPGHRAPHVWLDATETKSTLDLFGREFVLLEAADRAQQIAGVKTVDAEIPLRVEGLPSAAATEAYGVDPQGCVLIRPDGYVAARWSAPPDRIHEQLERALATVLGRDSTDIRTLGSSVTR
jgi:putative polyketide hydroxylase